MMVESHWSLLKRRYLLFHNRPRVDFVVYIMEKQLLPSFRNELFNLKNGRKKPTWWKEFVRDWNKARETEINRLYSTNYDTWTCSCPSFLQSRFLICKHLVLGRPLPEYRNVIRNRKPPFITFRRDRDRHYALVDQTEVSHMTSSSSLRLPSNLQCEGIQSQDENTTKAVDLMQEELVWFQKHVANMVRVRVIKQLERIAKNIITRMRKYRENVQKNLRSRKFPKTWENEDCINLP